MDLLRTADHRFANLPDWPFEPRVADVDGLQIAYVDEGPRAAAPVLLMHGEPSWSYLYRFMIPLLVADGHRVIAPDLVGFGRSDKPADRADHSYAAHVEWMRALLLEQIGLTDITMFCQDWGGLIGLRVLATDPGRFNRLVLANTGLPTGEQSMSEAFLKWQTYSQTVETFPVGAMVQGATTRQLTDAEVAAYDAPFPTEAHKEGPRIMPALVPTAPGNPASAANKAAWEVLQRFEQPVLTAFSDADPITAGGERPFQKMVPGAAGQPHTTTHGGHFLQEDCGPELATLISTFIEETGGRSRNRR